MKRTLFLASSLFLVALLLFLPSLVRVVDAEFEGQQIGPEEAIEAAARELSSRVVDGYGEFSLSTVNVNGDWAFFNIASKPLVPDPNAELIVPDVILGIAHYTGNSWQVALEPGEQYSLWLPTLPDSLVSQSAKETLQNNVIVSKLSANASTTATTYKIPGLPWKLGNSWKYTQGPHYGTQGALDFATPTGAAASVKAAESGVVIYSTETCVGVRRNGDNLRVWYQHINPADIATWTVGETMGQGYTIGLTTLTPGCGWPDPLTGHHVHVYFDLGPGQPANYIGSSYNNWVIQSDGSWGTINKCGVTLSPNGANVLYSNDICDVTPPVTTASITGSTSGSSWFTSPVTISLNASDAGGSGLKYTAFDIDWANPGSTSTWPYSTTFSQDGNHTLYYRSVDNANNTEALNSQAFKIDTVPPTSPSSVLPGCTATSGVWQKTCSTPSFTWVGGTDSTSGMAGYHYYWGSSSTGTTTNLISSTSFQPAQVQAGTYYFRLRSMDVAGNTSSWNTFFTLMFDNLPPYLNGLGTSTCAVNGQWQSSCQDPLISWPVGSDSHSGFQGFYLYWGTETAGRSDTKTVSTSYQAHVESDGVYYLRLAPIDNLDNVGAWWTIYTIKLDRGFPSVGLRINNGVVSTLSQQVTLQVQASDSTSGVAAVRFRNEDGDWGDYISITPDIPWTLPAELNRFHTVYAEVIDKAGNASFTDARIYFGEMNQVFLPLVSR